jgi:hypothetical protein
MVNTNENPREALRICQRWDELMLQQQAFPRGRMTEEEIGRFLVINGELQELLPRLPGWSFQPM